jgi:hypothetical protein
MALKQWLGKLAGPKNYGEALGRAAAENAFILANALFLSHATSPGKPETIIFDDSIAMKAAGFTSRSDDEDIIDRRSLNSDDRALLDSLFAAMFCFVYVLNYNAARQYMQARSYSKFNGGLAVALRQAAIDNGFFSGEAAAQSAVDPYFAAFDAGRRQTVLNFDVPASDDVFELLIATAVNRTGLQFRFAFLRSGAKGFGRTALALGQETLKSMLAATTQYGW